MVSQSLFIALRNFASSNVENNSSSFNISFHGFMGSIMFRSNCSEISTEKVDDAQSIWVQCIISSTNALFSWILLRSIKNLCKVQQEHPKLLWRGTWNCLLKMASSLKLITLLCSPQIFCLLRSWLMGMKSVCGFDQKLFCLFPDAQKNLWNCHSISSKR